MRTDRHAIVARAANLAVPGGGVILIGSIPFGLAMVIAFAVSANGAICGLLLFPDEWPAIFTGTMLGMAIATYVLAQLWMSRELRMRRFVLDQELRRAVLERAVQFARAGDTQSALTEIGSLGPLVQSDLLVAYRFAQIVSMTSDTDAARDAWRIVRALDRHKIYRHAVDSARIDDPQAAESER